MLTMTLPFTGPFSGYRHISVSFSGTSDWVAIPSNVSIVSVALHPDVAQTAKVQYTLSSPADVVTGSAHWIDWPAGSVIASTSDGMRSMCIGVRAVGDGVMEVLAK